MQANSAVTVVNKRQGQQHEVKVRTVLSRLNDKSYKMTIDIKRLAWQLQHRRYQGCQAIGTHFWDLERAIEFFSLHGFSHELLSSQVDLN
jgi:hypothetical protein